MESDETFAITEIRLTAFKSFIDVVLPIEPITILTGRNSSGKSNALDALEVLSRLSAGDELSDALDGRGRVSGTIRGGSLGCVPHGTNSFSLGATVSDGQTTYCVDLEIEVTPNLRVVSESLRGPGVKKKSGVIEQDAYLFRTRPAEKHATGISAEVYNGVPGPNPSREFRDSRLVLSQIPQILERSNQSNRSVIRGAEIVAHTLRSVFYMDPVPHLMREYVPSRDNELKRTGENISAALQEMKKQHHDDFQDIVQLASEVANKNINEFRFVTSELGDVMIALEERFQSTNSTTPAREMSDGLLRFLAIAAALKSPHEDLSVHGVQPGDEFDVNVQMIVEEVENGLHPSQADKILTLFDDSVRKKDTQVIATTHSPALLDSVPSELYPGILVCYRNSETGLSSISPLTELPSYVEAISTHSLGAAVTAGMLIDDHIRERDFSALDAIFSIG